MGNRAERAVLKRCGALLARWCLEDLAAAGALR